MSWDRHCRSAHPSSSSFSCSPVPSSHAIVEIENSSTPPRLRLPLRQFNRPRPRSRLPLQIPHPRGPRSRFILVVTIRSPTLPQAQTIWAAHTSSSSRTGRGLRRCWLRTNFGNGASLDALGELEAFFAEVVFDEEGEGEEGGGDAED